MPSKRVAVSVAFLFFGITSGTVLPRLPAIKDNLGISDGQIGFAFLAFAVGAVIAAAAARLVLARGARRPVRITTFLLCAFVVAPGIAPSYGWFFAALLVTGLIAGLVDVLLNAQATEIERQAGRPMINSFHAYWSLGSIVGSVAAAIAAAASLPVAIHFGIVGIGLAIVSVPLVAPVPDTRGGAATLMPIGSGRRRLGAAVAVISVLALVSVVVEGAGQDWSALYLRDFGHASESVAALGYAVMALTMTAARFSADRLTAATSARAVAGSGAAIVAGGFALAVAFPAPLVAIAGFGLIGAGVAVLFPLAMSASANVDEAGSALSLVTAAGYAGSIVAPPMIGAAADRLGLRFALLIPMVFALLVVGTMAGTRVLSSRTNRRLSDATERVEPEA